MAKLRVALTGMSSRLGAGMAQLLSGARGVVSLECGDVVQFVPVDGPLPEDARGFDGVLVVCGGSALLTLLPRLRHKPLAWIEYGVEDVPACSAPEVRTSMSQQGVFVVREARGSDVRWLMNAGASVANFFSREARVARALNRDTVRVRDPAREPLLPDRLTTHAQGPPTGLCFKCSVL